jgi:hypothetical protein
VRAEKDDALRLESRRDGVAIALDVLNRHHHAINHAPPSAGNGIIWRDVLGRADAE